MADIYSALGVAAGVVEILAFVPYIISTLQGKTKPDKATWLIWAVIGIIIAASYYASGARDTAWNPAAAAIGMTIIAALSLKYGEEGWTALDKWCLGGAAAGLALWAATSEPLLPYYVTTVVDGIGAVPTIKKARDQPESEANWAWPMFSVAALLNLLAIGHWTVAIAFYPVYVFILDVTMTALTMRARPAKTRQTL